MKLASFEAIVQALEEAQVRYLVAGGLAVSAHGYLRLTRDVDLVVQLLPDNIKRAFAALATLGYRPTVHGELPVRFVSIPTLIRMKEVAGRPQDNIDIEYLRMRLKQK